MNTLLCRSERDQQILSFAMGVCAIYYIFVNYSCVGDLEGDSWEYLSKAALIRSHGHAAYDYLRGYVYPWLIAKTWGADGSFTYFTQQGLFLAALFAATRSLALSSRYAVLPLLASMIPAVTFLQKQLYPDGLLASLVLLFFVFVARKQRIAFIIVALVLALTKLVFVVALPCAIAAYAVLRRPIRAKTFLGLTAIGVSLVPLCIFLFAATFVDLAYMVIFVRPYARGYGLERVLPRETLRFECGGKTQNVARADLFWEPIKAPYSVAPHGPLTPAQATAFGCTEPELRVMKRRLMFEQFWSDPLLHIRLGARAFALAIVGSSDLHHISYILSSRQQLWLSHFDEASYFTDSERKLMAIHRSRGMDIRQPQPLIFSLNAFAVSGAEDVIRYVAIAMTLLGVGVLWVRRALSLLKDEATIAIVLFLLTYSASITIAVPVVYDRYTYINLLLLCMLAARLAGLTLNGGALSGSEVTPVDRRTA